MSASRPALPYASGCKHASPCTNVYAGRACALDATKANGYDAEGRATVTYLEADEAQGVTAGSVVYAIDPYTGRYSGRRYGDPVATPEPVLVITVVAACPRCHGTGFKPYASMHPQCSDCYGTGRAGVTIGELERQAKLARELEAAR